MEKVKWYVNDNFISKKLNDKSWKDGSVIAECESHEAALEVAEAHNVDYKKFAEEKMVIEKTKNEVALQEVIDGMIATIMEDNRVVSKDVAVQILAEALVNESENDGFWEFNVYVGMDEVLEAKG